MRDKNEIEHIITLFAPTFEHIPAVCIVHNLWTNEAEYMCRFGLSQFSLTFNELRDMGDGYKQNLFNQDEVLSHDQKIAGLVGRNDDNEIISYFQQVRLSRGEVWGLWLTSMRIFLKDSKGQPILTLMTSVPVNAAHNDSARVVRLLDEDNYVRDNIALFKTLSKRETEILVLMASNQSGAAIASLLFLSEDTVKTHRKNIKRKIRATSYYDVVKFAQSFGLL